MLLSHRGFVLVRSLYLAISQKKVTAPILKDKLLSYGLTTTQVAQIFDIVFSLIGATKTSWLFSIFQVYGRLVILFSTQRLNPEVLSFCGLY